MDLSSRERRYRKSVSRSASATSEDAAQAVDGGWSGWIEEERCFRW